ncbi:siderophore biosynthesis protein [Actinocorallia sp. API 0066]|uniref:ATP-grasp domain-containing protein n=1 Tax=Actinocorallia sp. API 0066 TaxID=2896846 RepID=UPI001E34915D|nr:siderophore biosynthesis protein [Actinocorallia sp. API 0066]MCD0448087.1 siderophore biosynthesis protein [Actinocorallia sp. API 0066]
MRLFVVSGKATDSVLSGFLPAAERLGLDVTVLTDRPEQYPEHRTLRCDVSDFREIVQAGRPDAYFSNGDFLQTPTALAAEFYGLPGKDWKATLRCKNKSLMRRHLGDVWASPFPVPDDAPYPLVVKPREGVASEDVVLVRSPSELAALPDTGRPMVAEEYLRGPLHTLETLNGEILGSFTTTLSPEPHFIEERLDWAPPPPETPQVLAALERLGVGFGACHTEFVAHEGRARIIEVNYRIIGDHCDFLLAELLGRDLFADVLLTHLGQPPVFVPSPRGAATVEYLVADRSGTLTAAPTPGTFVDNGVSVTYRPQRNIGDVIVQTHTNRDYLGTVQVVGPDRPSVAAALARFRRRRAWAVD